MINPTKPQNFAKQIGTPYDGSPVSFSTTLPLDPALVDMTIYAQASIVNTNGFLRLTPGVAVAIGLMRERDKLRRRLGRRDPLAVE